MISILVSTRKEDENFKLMLLKSVGLRDAQLLIYENNGEKSLTEIYNQGLKDSIYDINVFVHDDVILDNGWGKKLLEHYQKSDYGVLGVAGSRELVDGRWWSNKSCTYGVVRHTNGEKTWTSEFSRNLGNSIQEVCCVDGVFFSVMKSRLKTGFDESYKGFHFYDISFCISNFLQGVKIGVHTNILLTHKSVGKTNEHWEESRIQLVNQYKDYLPLEVELEVPYLDLKIRINEEPKLAIIIPTKNNVDELLIPCLDSIIETTAYSNYIIYVADTGSNEIELSKLKNYISEVNVENEIIRLVEYDYYNFAKINNDVIKNKIDADTEILLLTNNDIEMVNDALSVLVETYVKNKKECGTVGCRLHYDNGTIQHMGIIIQETKDKNIGITHKFLGWDFKNTMVLSPIVRTHGNTAAFMLVSKVLFEEIGGFNESYKECFEDVEFNLQCFLKNKKNYTNSNGVCYHYESQTRGQKVDQEDVKLILDFIDGHEKIKNTFYQLD